MAQRAGATVWHCRVQAALLLKRTPEYADTNLICLFVSSAVAAVEASARRSVICPEQHGPARWRNSLALPSAGGFAAQAYARICRYQPDMSAHELSSRCCRSISP